MDAGNFREMIADNPNATWGVSLAANAVYASKYGYYGDKLGHRRDERWVRIARHLRDTYGESLDGEELLAEMDQS